MYWILLLGTSFISWLVSTVLDRRFKRYSQEPLPLTGREVAEKMLRDHGLTDVRVTCVSGRLTDHYNPSDNTVNLSEAVYNSASVAAAAVAAHECGHAVQHATAYAPLTLRSLMVPVVQFSSNIVMWVILAGMVFINIFPHLIWIGIALFACTTLFSFITLPVEINASARAINWLSEAGITDRETTPMATSALRAAAYTYVVAALSSLATLFYYITMASRRN